MSETVHSIQPTEGVHRCSQSRQRLSGTVVAGVALAAALVLASAPAASSHRTAARALTAQAARTVPPRADRSDERRRPSRHGRTAFATSRQRPIRSASAPRGRTAFDGTAVRVVVETERPGARARSRARRRRDRSSGRPAASCRPSWLQAELRAARPPSRRRPSSARPPYAQSRPRWAARRSAPLWQSAWHDKGFTGKGVKVADHRRGLLRSRRAPGHRRFAGERGDAGSLQWRATRCRRATVRRSRRSSTRWRPTHSCTSSASRTDVELRELRSHMRRARACPSINHSTGWEGPFRDDGSGPSVQWSPTRGQLGSSGATPRAMRREPLVRRVQPVLRRSGSPVGAERRRRQHVRLAERLGDLRFPEVGRVAGAASDFDLGLVSSGSNRLLAVSEDEQGAGQPPFEESASSIQRQRPDGLLGDPRVPGRVVAAHRPRQLEPAARVSGGRPGASRRPLRHLPHSPSAPSAGSRVCSSRTARRAPRSTVA